MTCKNEQLVPSSKQQMFTAQCKPSSYKPVLGDFAIDANGEIAIVTSEYNEAAYSINPRRGYRCLIGDCRPTKTYAVTDRFSYIITSFTPIKYISKADIVDHFNMNVIYNYRTYTQAFYDIFTLDGDTITLRDKQDPIVDQNTSIVEQNANILDQNLLLLKQNSLLMEQNGLLLQLLAEKKVPEQADLLQL